jgi:hypothetical protein
MGMPGNTPRTLALRCLRTGRLEWRTAPQWHRRQAARIAGAHSAPAVTLHCCDSFWKPNHATSSTLPSRPVSSRNYAPSPSTGQDVVRITLTVFPKLLGTFATQTLAARYDADPSAADWRRFGSSSRWKAFCVIARSKMTSKEQL